MSPHEAIEQLEAMQRQIVHGKRTFGDIADCIRKLLAALQKYCPAVANEFATPMTITFTGRCKGCGVSIIRDRDFCDECSSRGDESPLPE